MDEDKNIIQVDFIDGELVIKEGDLIVKQDNNYYLGSLPIYYALDENKNPYSIDRSKLNLETYKRVVKQELYLGFFISTVFTGIDQAVGLMEKPLLFETVIFSNDDGPMYMERCCTWDEALTKHEEAKKWLEIYVNMRDKNESNRRKRLVAKPERDA